MATKKKPTREEFAAGMKKELAKVEEAFSGPGDKDDQVLV